MTHEQLIQNYFKGTLPESDLQSVETLLKTDSNFKAEFEGYESMQLAFKEQERQTLKARLQHLETQSSTIRKKWHQQSWLGYAAIAVVFLGLGYSFFYDSSSNFYEDYYDVYPNVEQPIVRGEKQTTAYDAFQAYENGNYSEAVSHFETSLKEENNPNFRFYYAMALLNTSDFEKANTELQKLSKIKFDYQPEALWYSALIYLKSEQFGLAKEKLITLDTFTSTFKSKERKLLLQKLKDK